MDPLFYITSTQDKVIRKKEGKNRKEGLRNFKKFLFHILPSF